MPLVATFGMLALLTSCGTAPSNGSQSSGSQSSASGSRIGKPAATPASLFGHLPVASSPRLSSPPPVSCIGDVGNSDPVAIVTLHGQDNIVLRDYADESHPRTFCSFGPGVSPFSILDPHHVAAFYGPATVVLELPSGRALEVGVNGFVVAVAPDTSQVLDFSGDPPALHDTWDSGDVVIQAYPTPAGRCGGGPWPGAFSRDSKYGFAIWDQGPNATFMNIVGNHQGLYAEVPPPGGWTNLQQPNMAIWSPVEDKLYFSKQNAVWTWTPSGGASQLRAGLSWYYPSMSPDGKRLAYEAWGPNFTSPTVHLMDPVAGTDIAQIGSAPSELPTFLGNDLLWFRTQAGGCGPNDFKSYVYDFRDNSLSGSIVDWVSATWPGTSAIGG